MRKFGWGLAVALIVCTPPAMAGAQTITYRFGPGEAPFRIPPGDHTIFVEAVGGTGGFSSSVRNGGCSFEVYGGRPAIVSGTIPVEPGSTVYIDVGERGRACNGAGHSFGGGGSPARTVDYASGGGGGASDVRTTPSAAGLSPDTRLIVAGGGGGAGIFSQGGDASEYGGEGAYGGGEPGTLISGGLAAEGCGEIFGGNGTLGEGGDGAAEPDYDKPSGAGGGGLYGGGAGGTGCYGNAGGGGGGSSLVPAGGTIRTASQFNTESGYVQITFNEPAIKAPTAVTGEASGLTAHGATLNATVNPNGTALETCRLEYGTTESYGSSVDCSPWPGGATNPKSVAGTISGLQPGMTYHFRVRAQSEGGASNGSDVTFATTAAESAPTMVKPSDQTSTTGFPITPVVIAGSRLATLTAANLPPGLALSEISESEWRITGSPTTPKAASTVTLEAHNSEGSIRSVAFQWTIVQASAPAVSKMTPKNGPATGGTTVTITGTAFASVQSVKFGATAAGSYTVNSPTSITAVSPAGIAGHVYVVVTTAGGATSETAKSKFTYKKVKTAKGAATRRA